MSALLYTFPLTSSYLQAEKAGKQPAVGENVKCVSEDSRPLVLYGEEQCGKTSLLFQAAVSYVTKDIPVTYICRQAFTKLPLMVHGMPRPETAGHMKSLTFLYMNSVEELVNYCSTIHTRTVLPEVIMVDDLDYYITQKPDHSVEASAARLCAMLQDTTGFIRNKSGSGRCMLLAGCRNKVKSLPGVFSQYKFHVANISESSAKDHKYTIDVHLKHQTLNLSYRLESSGIYLQDVHFIT